MSPRRFAAVALAGSLLLAGCSDDPEPRFEEPTKSSSPSASESSSAAEEQTAEEFIREWFARAVEMQNSGQTAPLLAMSPGCRPCRELAERVEVIYAAGGDIRIDHMHVQSIRPVTRSEFSVTVKASATRVRQSDDSKQQTLPGNINEYRMFLGQDGSTWLMRDYQDTPS